MAYLDIAPTTVAAINLLGLGDDDRMVVTRCVAGYSWTVEADFDQILWFLKYRIANVILSLLGESDWQKSEAILKNHYAHAGNAVVNGLRGWFGDNGVLNILDDYANRGADWGATRTLGGLIAHNEQALRV